MPDLPTRSTKTGIYPLERKKLKGNLLIIFKRHMKETELGRDMGRWRDQKLYVDDKMRRVSKWKRRAYCSWKELYEHEYSLAWITALKMLLINNSTIQ